MVHCDCFVVSLMLPAAALQFQMRQIAKTRHKSNLKVNSFMVTGVIWSLINTGGVASLSHSREGSDSSVSS